MDKDYLTITGVSLEKKIEDLMNRINQAMESKFSNLAESKNRAEVVVLFLAMLHLIKDKLIKVEQNQPFSDILIKKSIP